MQPVSFIISGITASTLVTILNTNAGLLAFVLFLITIESRNTVAIARLQEDIKLLLGRRKR